MLRAILCHPEICFRFALCAILKKKAILRHTPDWRCANFVISRADMPDNNDVFFTRCIWSNRIHSFKRQTNKHYAVAWSYFWSPCVRFYASKPYIKHAASIWRGLHSANLEHVSGWHISERCTMPIWNMFQEGTCLRTARNTYNVER